MSEWILEAIELCQSTARDPSGILSPSKSRREKFSESSDHLDLGRRSPLTCYREICPEQRHAENPGKRLLATRTGTSSPRGHRRGTTTRHQYARAREFTAREHLNFEAGLIGSRT